MALEEASGSCAGHVDHNVSKWNTHTHTSTSTHLYTWHSFPLRPSGITVSEGLTPRQLPDETIVLLFPSRSNGEFQLCMLKINCWWCWKGYLPHIWTPAPSAKAGPNIQHSIFEVKNWTLFFTGTLLSQ